MAGSPDAGLLRDRWPDVLEAVRGERKVAWMLLTNATVESLADGVLTVEFAREGDAKGFVSSGCGDVLGGVLQTMFGISPQLKTTARTPGVASVGARAPAVPGRQGGSGGAGGPGGRGGSAGFGNTAAPAAPGGAVGPEAAAAGDDAQAGWNDPPPAWDDPAAGWDDPRDDDPDDVTGPTPAPPPPQNSRAGSGAGSRPSPAQAPANRALTAMDLIERELGGRVIEDAGDA